jgi:hypothetical protein
MKPTTNREIERPFIHATTTTPTDNGQRTTQGGAGVREREEEVDGHELATAENETRGATDQGGACERANKEQVRAPKMKKPKAKPHSTQAIIIYYYLLFIIICWLHKRQKKKTKVLFNRHTRALTPWHLHHQPEVVVFDSMVLVGSWLVVVNLYKAHISFPLHLSTPPPLRLVRARLTVISWLDPWSMVVDDDDRSHKRATTTVTLSAQSELATADRTRQDAMSSTESIPSTICIASSPGITSHNYTHAPNNQRFISTNNKWIMDNR